jgi:hypothetical protein
MPATSIRDVIVKGDDLIAATHGRGFWILDDITPLRQLKDSDTAPVVLFKPETAMRVRWNTNTDTPIPPDEAAGKNPPDGALIDFYLNGPAAGVVTLEILDRTGKTVIRRYASDQEDENVDLEKLQVPTYWARRPRRLPNGAGMHRVIWDMHYTPVSVSPEELPMQAVFEDTAPANHAPWVLPGTYTVRLTVDGKSYQQPLLVKMDPRVKTPAAGLTEQFVLSKKVYDELQRGSSALKELQARRVELRDHSDEQSKALDKKLEEIEGRKGARFGGGGRLPVNGPPTLSMVVAALETLLNALQDADVAPTSQQRAAVTAQLAEMDQLIQRWDALKK